jgi:hypothetical protein
MTRIPREDIEALGFKCFDNDCYNPCVYEKPDGTLIEDVNSDESVNLDVLLYVLCDSAAYDAVERFKERVKNYMEKVSIDIDELTEDG